MDLPLSVANRDRRRGLRRLQSRASDKNASSLKRLTVGSAGCHSGCVIAIIEMLLRLVNSCVLSTCSATEREGSVNRS